MNGGIAIVGMAVVLGPDDGLAEFDRTIFDGLTHSAGLVPGDNRTPVTAARRGADDTSDTITRAQRLATVIERARTDRRSPNPDEASHDLAVIVVSDTDRRVPGVVPEPRLCEPSTALAFHAARRLLDDRGCPGVVIGSVNLGDPDPDAGAAHSSPQGLAPRAGAAAVFLKRLDQAQADHDRVYAVIEALVLDPDGLAPGAAPSPDQRTTAVCTKAFDAAGVRPAEIAYLELSGTTIEEQDEHQTRGLVQAYSTGPRGLTCALGSVTSNLGRLAAVSGLASLIKTALCLYHRYIPATPNWTGPGEIDRWERGPFYVAVESRPWFPDPTSPRRVAAIHSADRGGVAHWVLSEPAGPEPRLSPYLSLCAPACFPLSGDRPADLLTQLDALRTALGTAPDLHSSATAAFRTFQATPSDAYALMLVAHTREELSRELQFMQKRLLAAVESGLELKTPGGSYFTPRPLGRTGTVAFVYPGIGSAYVGLGRALFHLFPGLYDRFSLQTSDMGGWMKDRELYPRTRRPLTQGEILDLEDRLREDIVGMCYCATAFCVLYTTIMADVFKVEPRSALGYSWGEPGMVASFRLWSDLDPLKERLATFPTFTSRLHRAMTTVRDQWSLKPWTPGSGERIWESYTVQASPLEIEQAIQQEPRVFLTIINSPDEGVIAGDPEACLRVIKRLGCAYYPLSLDIAIHCGIARPEHDAIAEIFTLPLHHKPPVKFFSSSCYKAIPITSKTIAFSIARAFSEPVDFPRLVSQAYESGTRIFIELGPRKFCSNMIERILKGQDHLALSINVKGARDETSLVRVLSQLVSHRVPVDLTPLYRM